MTQIAVDRNNVYIYLELRFLMYGLPSLLTEPTGRLKFSA
jgi:hypothetical protein